MKIVFVLLFIVLSGCSKDDNISQYITTMTSQTGDAKTRVEACINLADYKETRVINSLVNSLNDIVIKGCATRSLILINSPESLSALLKFIEGNDFDSTIFSMAVRFGNDDFLSKIKDALITVKSHSETNENDIQIIDKLMKELIAKGI